MSYYANLFGQYISKYYIITAIFIYCFYIFYFRADLEKGMHIKIKKVVFQCINQCKMYKLNELLLVKKL